MDLGQLFDALEAVFSNTIVLTFFILIIAFFANALIRLTERKPMREIEAFDSLVMMAGASIESNSPVHMSLGSAIVGDDTTMLALLGSEFIYYMAREVAIGDAPPLFTVAEGVAIPLATDTLRRAYEQENRSNAYNGLNFFSKTPISTRWYPSGQRSLAFASSLMTLQADDKLSGNVLMGRYGIEMSLVLDAAYRHDIPTFASTDQIDGQAIAYAMADGALIGEEALTASAYPDDGYRLQKRNFAIDFLRGLVVATIIGLALYNFFVGS